MSLELDFEDRKKAVSNQNWFMENKPCQTKIYFCNETDHCGRQVIKVKGDDMVLLLLQKLHHQKFHV